MKNKKIILISVIVLLTICAISSFYMGRVYYIKKYGITLTSKQDFTPKKLTYFLQNDSEWSKDKIGNTNSTLAYAGCLISCVATSVTSMGTYITPKTLNEKLTSASGYLADNLIWNKINTVEPKVDYSYKRIFNSKTIEKNLLDGLLPIVNVKYNKTGITHWVVIVGSKDNDFIIYDPANQNKEYIKLSTHGKVYAYRVLKNVTN